VLLPSLLLVVVVWPESPRCAQCCCGAPIVDVVVPKFVGLIVFTFVVFFRGGDLFVVLFHYAFKFLCYSALEKGPPSNEILLLHCLAK